MTAVRALLYRSIPAIAPNSSVVQSEPDQSALWLLTKGTVLLAVSLGLAAGTALLGYKIYQTMTEEEDPENDLTQSKRGLTAVEVISESVCATAVACASGAVFAKSMGAYKDGIIQTGKNIKECVPRVSGFCGSLFHRNRATANESELAPVVSYQSLNVV